MIMRMLTEFEGKIDEHRNSTKDKYQVIELKNTVTTEKYVRGIQYRLAEAEAGISQFENTAWSSPNRAAKGEKE